MTAVPAWAKGRDESEVRLEVEDYVAASEDLGWLKRIERAARAAREEIGRLTWEAAVERKWAEAGTWRKGTVLWCCAAGTFLGGGIQRGTRFVVDRNMRTARTLHLTRVGEDGRRDRTWMKPAGVLKYDLRPTPPDQPPPNAAEVRMAEAAGRVLNG
jgi:hypothetical protein